MNTSGGSENRFVLFPTVWVAVGTRDGRLANTRGDQLSMYIQIGTAFNDQSFLSLERNCIFIVSYMVIKFYYKSLFRIDSLFLRQVPIVSSDDLLSLRQKTGTDNILETSCLSILPSFISVLILRCTSAFHDNFLDISKHVLFRSKL